eukprot:7523632-Pyramimonas_sp.AAC.1
MFLPHLAGERSPFTDPAARGAFVGLSFASDRGTLARCDRGSLSFQRCPLPPTVRPRPRGCVRPGNPGQVSAPVPALYSPLPPTVDCQTPARMCATGEPWA